MVAEKIWSIQICCYEVLTINRNTASCRVAKYVTGSYYFIECVQKRLKRFGRYEMVLQQEPEYVHMLLSHTHIFILEPYKAALQQTDYDAAFVSWNIPVKGSCIRIYLRWVCSEELIIVSVWLSHIFAVAVHWKSIGVIFCFVKYASSKLIYWKILDVFTAKNWFVDTVSTMQFCLHFIVHYI